MNSLTISPAGVERQRTAHYGDASRSRKGVVTLRRLGLDVPFESTLEERFLRVLDTCPSVIRVERGQTVQVVAPNGESHSYTPDFMVTLDGRVVVVECKPMALLGQLLRDDLMAWQLRHQFYHLQGQSLRVVTDADLPIEQMAHVTHFAGFLNAPVNDIVRSTALNFVRERGAVLLTALRHFLLGLLKLPPAEVDGTLYGLIARQELLADLREKPPHCMVDIRGRIIPLPPEPLGQPLDHYLRHLPEVTSVPPKRISAELRLEGKFIETERGKKFFRIFSACLGDPAQLTTERMTELAEQESLSVRTVQRFSTRQLRFNIVQNGRIPQIGIFIAM